MQNLTKYFKLCSVLIGLAAIVILLRPDSLVKAGYVFNPFTKKLDYVNDIVPGGVVGTSTANYVAFYLNATTVTGTPFLTIGSTGIIFTTASGTSITSTNAFFSSLAFTDAVGTNLTLSNLTSTNASFANGKITIDDAASAVFVLANEQAMGAAFDTGLVSDFYSVNAGPGGQTQYIGAYWSPDMTTTGIMTIYRYGRGHDSGNAIIIDGAANTMEIPLDTTFLSGLNFVNATGTSITTTNAFATNLGTTNFSATNGSFTNLTSTNLFATSSNLIGLTFTNASGTTLTSTNSYFNNVYINTTTQLGTVSLQGVPSLDLVKAVSSSGAQIFAIKPNGQVVIGPNSLSQTGHQTLEHPTTNDYALTFTNGVHYTAMLGRQPGTSGQMAIGGLSGTSLNLWAGGSSGMIILNTNRFVGINSSTPSTRFVVVGTSTFDGAILQTNLGDCDASTQNVTYDLTTGQFGCGTDDNNEQRVGTSTANYFTFYDTATSVTGTSWVQFSGGALTVTTNTNFTIVSSTNALFGNATTTNLGVTSIYGNPNATVVSGYLYVSSVGGFYVQNTATFRGNVRNDTGANLTITGGTTGNTNFTGTISVVGTSTLATTTVTSLTFVTATGTTLTSTNIYNTAFFQPSLTDCDAETQTVNYDLMTGAFSCLADDTAVQRVGTSTADYFTFYDTATSVTGTSWVQFSGGALTVTTNTNFTIVSSTSGLFGSVTTTNLAVTGSLSLPNNSITDAMVVAGLTINGGTIDNTPIGNTTPSTGIFTNVTSTNLFATSSIFISATSTNLFATSLTFTNASGTTITSTNGIFTNLTFTNATGTVLYLSSALNINNALTVNSVGDVSASGTLRVFGTATFGADTNEVFVRNLYRAVNSTSTIVDYSSDPDVLARGTSVATTLAVYSDDITRILVQNTAAGASGVVSLKNKSLTPANTNLDSTYNNAGTLQTITATTLSGGGGAATVRGALTYQGYHYLMICNGGTCTIKRATSTWDNDLSVLANWVDATVSGSFDGSMLGLIGAYNGNIYMASNTDDILPYAITTSTNTLTAGTPVNIALNHSLNCTRVNDNGIMTGCDGVPQIQFYNHSGTRLYPFGAGLGASAPATAGPSIFVTRKSNYIINGSATALTKLNFVQY